MHGATMIHHAQTANRTDSVGWVNSCVAGIYALTTEKPTCVAATNSNRRALLMIRAAFVAWSQKTLSTTEIGKSP
jgi:hypothetical protein